MAAQEDFPENAMPYLSAAATYSAELVAATLFGDWTQAEAAYAEMALEQSRWLAAAVAASSQADSEADYYGPGVV
jgi:hypothetical protein